MKQTKHNLGGGILISTFLQYNLSATAIKVSITTLIILISHSEIPKRFFTEVIFI